MPQSHKTLSSGDLLDPDPKWRGSIYSLGTTHSSLSSLLLIYRSKRNCFPRQLGSVLVLLSRRRKACDVSSRQQQSENGFPCLPFRATVVLADLIGVPRDHDSHPEVFNRVFSPASTTGTKMDCSEKRFF